jgi:hypothetical protein
MPPARVAKAHLTREQPALQVERLAVLEDLDRLQVEPLRAVDAKR